MESEKIEQMRNLIDFAKENFLDQACNFLDSDSKMEKKLLVDAYNRICELMNMETEKVFIINNNRDFALALLDAAYDSEELFESLLDARMNGLNYVWCCKNPHQVEDVDFVVLMEHIEINFECLFKDVVENPSFYHYEKIIRWCFPTEYISE